MYYTYILKLSDGSLYVGSSSNLKQRLDYHKSKKVNTTKKSQSIKLIFYAAFINKVRAIKFEKYLKSSSGFAFRKKRLI